MRMEMLTNRCMRGHNIIKIAGDWETDFRKGSKWSGLATGNTGMALRQVRCSLLYLKAVQKACCLAEMHEPARPPARPAETEAAYAPVVPVSMLVIVA